MKSSTDYFLILCKLLCPEARRRTRSRPWDFSLWAPAIRFCAISWTDFRVKTVWSTRFRLWRRARSRACDVLRLTHKDGAIYYINLLSVGFAADVAALRHRRFQGLGQFGYLLSIFLCLARLDRRPFPVRFDDQQEFDSRPCLFLTFNNSKFTGGTMMIAPDAVTDDGLIEYVRWGPIGRLGLIRNLATLYDGTHTRHPLAERQGGSAG